MSSRWFLRRRFGAYQVTTRGPRPTEILLSEQERTQLQSWARGRSVAAGLATRSRIVLAAADAETNTAIAHRVGVSRPTVTTWRARFAEHRLSGLTDQPRSGRPRTFGDTQTQALIKETLETTPPETTRWSTRLMAAHVGMSPSTVSRVWRTHDLAPHTMGTSEQPQRPEPSAHEPLRR